MHIIKAGDGWKIQLSNKSDWASQRNNQIWPLSSCGTTSAIMGLKATGIDIPKTEGQPEDALTRLLETNEAYQIMKQIAPWAYDASGIPIYPPRQVHLMLEWGINEFIGKEVDVFSDSVSMKRILYNIAIDQGAVLVNGRFTSYGHIVCIVGFQTQQKDIFECVTAKDIKLDKVDHVIVDDPYGDYHSGYIVTNGNDIEFTLNEFNHLTNNYNDMRRKWAHLLKKV